MKSFLVMLFLINSASVLAQTNNNDDLSDFIRRRHYVQLTDTAHLPKNILPYVQHIASLLSAKNYALPATTYVWVSYVRDNPDQVTVPVTNITGIKLLKHMEDDALKVKDTTINGKLLERLRTTFIGNPDGELELVINKINGTIATYIPQ